MQAAHAANATQVVDALCHATPETSLGARQEDLITPHSQEMCDKIAGGRLTESLDAEHLYNYADNSLHVVVYNVGVYRRMLNQIRISLNVNDLDDMLCDVV